MSRSLMSHPTVGPLRRSPNDAIRRGGSFSRVRPPRRADQLTSLDPLYTLHDAANYSVYNDRSVPWRTLRYGSKSARCSANRIVDDAPAARRSFPQNVPPVPLHDIALRRSGCSLVLSAESIVDRNPTSGSHRTQGRVNSNRILPKCLAVNSGSADPAAAVFLCRSVAGGNGRNNEIRSYQVALESATRAHDDGMAPWTTFLRESPRYTFLGLSGVRQPARVMSHGTYRCIF